MINYMPINGQHRRKGKILRKTYSSKTEPGGNIKYDKSNQKYWNWNCDLKISNKQMS